MPGDTSPQPMISTSATWDIRHVAPSSWLMATYGRLQGLTPKYTVPSPATTPFRPKLEQSCAEPWMGSNSGGNGISNAGPHVSPPSSDFWHFRGFRPWQAY